MKCKCYSVPYYDTHNVSVEVFPYSGKNAHIIAKLEFFIFPTKIPQHFGERRNFQEFGSSFLGFSSEVSLISGGRYSLSLVTIVSKANH